MQSVVIHKIYEGETDYLSEALHERLKIALKHDSVTIEGFRYVSGIGVVADGDYEIAWITTMLDYPIAKASFKVEVTPYDNFNDNCQTCEEATQLNLVDDTITSIYESIDEGTTVYYNVFANDTICCKPIRAIVRTTNSLYVYRAEIDETTGVITIEMNPTAPSATNANLLTYRVTCPNGSYDEADVFGNVSGSEESCEAPGSLDAGPVTENEATPNWFDLPTPLPLSYNYALYKSDNLFIIIHSGNTTDTSVHFDDLEAGVCYTFFVQSVCESGTSDFINIEFCTPSAGTQCGVYNIIYNDGSGNRGHSTTITFLNCLGEFENKIIFNLGNTLICALEDSPGNPVSIIGATEFEYFGPC